MWCWRCAIRPAIASTNREATFYLAFDVLQLAALLYLTGGITNPFALMFVAPVVIARRHPQSRQYADPGRHRLRLGHR